MLKKILFFAAVVVMALPASAQTKEMLRHEVSISYGAVPVTGWVNEFTKILLDEPLRLDSDVTHWGAVSAGYNYRLTKTISLGGELIYASSSNNFKKLNTRVTTNFISILPNMKISWANWRIVSLYSRLGAGVTFASVSGDTDHDGHDDGGNETLFGYQVSLLGIDVGGRHLGGFAEAGVGVSGTILAGLRYRF